MFDLLVIDLYPFEETVAKGGERQAIIETIDIGGPAMIRAAAKNHAYLSVVVDPADYAAVLTELDGHGGATTARFRRALAAKAFSRTAATTPRSRAGRPTRSPRRRTRPPRPSRPRRAG